jgi:predicted NodU family carbamoyl transferase
MDILGYKSGGHDGTLCYLSDGRLVFSIEAEKDSGVRHALFDAAGVARVLDRWRCRPQLTCGDSRHWGGAIPDNYVGHTPERILRGTARAQDLAAPYLSVPHELCHIASSFALSALPERTPFYALVWEGYLGRFYHVDANFNVTKLGPGNHVIDFVGVRYAFPYHATARSDMWGHAAAGKIMALAGLADPALARSAEVRTLADHMLDAALVNGSGRIALDGDWRWLYESLAALRDVPVTDPTFVALCKAMQDGVFARFLEFARQHLTQRLPLLISGGCGLNCDWNTMWRESGLFDCVFVPPVTNDPGIAIGAAAIVQHRETGRMKVAWDVYAGEEFVDEPVDFATEGFLEMDLDNEVLVEWLARWKMVVAWIQGRYEIGARALCHRSLIAAPFERATQAELNRIKQRESFRPVAPVCLEEDVSEHFEWHSPSPHMLYFQIVKNRALEAVTHADGTARAQTVSQSQDPATHALLRAFRARTGVGVLCNTSLNFLGRGFINRTTDIVRYVKQTDIPAFVINRKMYLSARKQTEISRTGH